jgi:3-dehydroquinate synthetase
MVDSSVGGKTGINHTAGKNLIGAFYQPPLVIIDPRFLQTLPRRELVAGWAEVIKHAVIQPSTPGGERADLLRYIERNAARLTALQEPATTYAIRRNVALKAAVVQADERESGIRSYLNFGHTLGHAIEAAGYHLLHGEAVALGMRAAMRIGQALGTTGEEMVRRVDALIRAFGLPLEAPFDEDSVLQIITRDKKRVAGTQRWVLPLSEGGVCIRTDVSQDVIRSAMRVIRAT